MVPFVVRLIDREVETSVVDGVTVKVDPGSRTTGLAVVEQRDTLNPATGETTTVKGLWLGELVLRGLQIKRAMHSRAALRRGRRSRNLRYRQPRFNNRTRPEGWLPPSLQHRVDVTLSWVRRLSRWAPVIAVAYELVRFDTQAIENPDISGVEYQQGALAGWEVREYLYAKWGYRCAYCDAPGAGVQINIDHVVPRSRGGSSRVSNLVPACRPCNELKDTRLVEDFLAHDPARLARITAGLKRPLRDAAAVNTTRWVLWRQLTALGYQVTTGTGGQTRWNRYRHRIPKSHALDALCVGAVDAVASYTAVTNQIMATGRGSYARTRSNKYGFPRLRLTRTKRHYGFATGDLVRAVVPAGKNTGTHIGKIAVRASGSFNITTTTGVAQGIHHRHVTLIQRGDGYTYKTQPTPTKGMT